MSLSEDYKGKSGPRSSADVVKDTVEIISSFYNRKENVTGISTGFHDLDIKTAGLHPGQLVAVAGYSGLGKTAFVLSLLRNVSVRNNIPGLFFTFRMMNSSLMTRMICAESRVDIHKVRTGFFREEEWPKIHEAAERIGGSAILIDNTLNMTVSEIRRRIKYSIKKSGVKFVCIDSFNLLKDMNVGDYTDAEEVALCLKEIAMEADVPIVVTVDLKPREGRVVPEMVDIWKIGKIDKHTDVLMFLHTEDFPDTKEGSHEKAELIIAKNNTGPTGKVEFTFIPEYLTFEEDNVC